MNGSHTVCSCGAIREVAPPDERRGDAAIIAWRGGNIGEGRVALERWARGATTCPACQHRACVYVVTRSTAAKANVASARA
jgi:hypothetical protein